MPLDTRYRPRTFDEVIGQDVVVSILKAIVAQKKFSSSYMISGPTGTGKTTLGRLLAKAILCDSPVDGNPCCTCESCRLFQEEKNFGYREMDSASVGGKEDMVRLRDEAAYLSVGRMKVILLDECHDISKQGQDALLDQVEKCPPHLVYIFCTTEPGKIKPTLRKRCIHFQVNIVESQKIIDRLKIVCSAEKMEYEEPALALIADRSKGHVRDALKLLEEASYFGPVKTESVQKLSVDHSQIIFDMLSNLGKDLPASIEACRKAGSSMPVRDLYDTMLEMVGDAVKLFYGYDGFIPQRKELLTRLRDIHGSSLMEFLNYLVTRDKFIDRIGLQSDIILLHYKFCADSFKPQAAAPIVQTEKAPEAAAVPSTTVPSSSVTHAHLQKLSIKDRAAALRDQWSNQNGAEKEDPQKVPVTWSLPKEERQGANSFDDDELTPLDFSRLLVGGRGNAV